VRLKNSSRKWLDFFNGKKTPSVDLDDLVNLVGYATTQAGVVGLARHGDSKTMERFRDRKRSEFIKDSILNILCIMEQKEIGLIH
jgi:hypothetical protein